MSNRNYNMKSEMVQYEDDLFLCILVTTVI